VGLDFNPRPAKSAFYVFIYLFLATPHGMWDLKFPYQGSNPCPPAEETGSLKPPDPREVPISAF